MADAAGPHDPAGRAGEFWDEGHAHAVTDSFLQHPLVEAYLSVRAFGSLRSHLQVAIEQLRARTAPGARALSIGCGGASKELALAEALPEVGFVAIDVARATLERARGEAARRGVRNLELAYGDFNRLELQPASLDAVLCLGALHHVENLEGFWQQCRAALRPGGFVLAQEYVGPARFQWTDAQVHHGDRVLRDLVPARHRVHHDRVTRVDVAELVRLDPSEAVRSDELLSTCAAAGFAVEDYRGGGGGLLQPVLTEQTHTFDPRDWEHNRVLFALFEEEDRLISAGEVGDHYAMFVAS